MMRLLSLRDGFQDDQCQVALLGVFSAKRDYLFDRIPPARQDSVQ